MQVETAFHNFLHTFKPFWKFWGTKCLVSMAFLQELIFYMPPFSDLSKTKQHLMYASLLCHECFLVSLLHCYAWTVKEPWLFDPAADEHGHEVAFPAANAGGGSVEMVPLSKSTQGTGQQLLPASL
eukprot:TRINITY_DN32709_c0_g1_i1.p4 TRINITY_DN32709_c0_g1~~TRINITY_DN32709_c0_g1_i1.p4  ORF type:complete len:126 (+),score=20.45 TRINITY_DN32709_c0_g1_i1:1183-1560(+)